MIRLTQAQMDQITASAEAAYPAECCGLLVGQQTSDDKYLITRIVPSPNVTLEQATDRFEIDPQIRLNLERELRGHSDYLIGHYHSHPDHPAMPSKTDLARTYEPALIWLIASVAAGRVQEVKAHRLSKTGENFSEMPCEIS